MCLGKFCAKIPDFVFERLNAVKELSLFQFFQSPALGDVLGAVPIEGGEVNEDETLGATFRGNLQLVLPIGRVVPGYGFDVREYLEPALVGVVHEKEGGAIVGAEVASGDVLAVAGDVSVGEGAIVDHVEESGRAAAELNVGPT